MVVWKKVKVFAGLSVSENDILRILTSVLKLYFYARDDILKLLFQNSAKKTLAVLAPYTGFYSEKFWAYLGFIGLD